MQWRDEVWSSRLNIPKEAMGGFRFGNGRSGEEQHT